MERITRSMNAKEFRATENEGKRYIEGYFSVFNSPYEIWEDATEIVLPGAFARSLAENDIRALINHDDTLVLGRTAASTVELWEDDHGLYGRVEINARDTDALNLYERVKRGDVSGASFGFMIRERETEYHEDGSILWKLKDVDMHEVSVVTFPAYEATEINARSKDMEQVQEYRMQLWRGKMMQKLKGEGNGTQSTDASKEDRR